jgi:C4-dicarboxylate transporter DctM subunit
MQTLLLYFGLFGAFFVFGIPIVLALAIAAIVMLIMNNMDLLIFAQKFILSMDNFGLVAMFFFIFAGEIMNGGGMTRRIIAGVSKPVKRVPGGLAIIAICSCALFAAINGSAIATAIAIGSILYPAMVKQGYGKAFSAAVIAGGGVIGPIIPPSIPMIVYGSTTGDSIGALFSGGIVLGVLIAAAECLVAFLISKKRRYGMDTDAIDFGDTKGFVWAVIFPLLIFGSIVGGFMTATETSAFAVIYAWFVGTFIYKEFDIRELPNMIRRSMASSGMVMGIVGAASAVAWVLTYERVPQQVTEAMVSGIGSTSVFMLVSFFLLLIIGMIMDLTPAILILAPIFMGPIVAFGVDPIYFGVFFCSILTVGLVTPPVGTLIYTGCSTSGKNFTEVVKELFPFMIAIYVALFIVVIFPEIITFLPKNVFGLYQ